MRALVRATLAILLASAAALAQNTPGDLRFDSAAPHRGQSIRVVSGRPSRSQPTRVSSSARAFPTYWLLDASGRVRYSSDVAHSQRALDEVLVPFEALRSEEGATSHRAR